MYHQYAVLLHLRAMHAFPGMHACRDVYVMHNGVFLHTCIYAYVGILPGKPCLGYPGRDHSAVCADGGNTTTTRYSECATTSSHAMSACTRSVFLVVYWCISAFPV